MTPEELNKRIDHLVAEISHRAEYMEVINALEEDIRSLIHEVVTEIVGEDDLETTQHYKVNGEVIVITAEESKHMNALRRLQRQRLEEMLGKDST